MLSQLTRKVSSPNVFTKLSLAVADLVRLAVLLAPVAEPSTMRSPLKYLARLSTVAGVLPLVTRAGKEESRRGEILILITVVRSVECLSG